MSATAPNHFDLEAGKSEHRDWLKIQVYQMNHVRQWERIDKAAEPIVPKEKNQLQNNNQRIVGQLLLFGA